MLLRPRQDFYTSAHPGPGDVLLLVEIYRDPAPNGYREIRVARRGDRLTPLALPDVALSVDDILL